MDIFVAFILAAFLVGFPVAFAITWNKLTHARHEIKELKVGSEAVSNADAYSAEQHANADAYSAEQHADADAYSAKQHANADAYYSQKQDEADKLLADAQRRADSLKQEIRRMTSEKQQLSEELAALDTEALSSMVKIDAWMDLKSDEIKNQLVMLRGRQDDMVKLRDAALLLDSLMAEREIKTQVKQMLRCFNAECANILGGVTVKNVDAARSKIQRSFDAINKIFLPDGVQISAAYLSAKYEELSLIYAYMVKEEEEKEQRRAIREQMVEEEKVRREIEREKQKLDKEEAQFRGEVNKLMSYMQKAKDDVERQLYIDKINELETKLKALETDKQNVLDREQNTRAGFVYIISNIGSFGERVFKIGMTRRLEPMDRIAELSSASVPFPFDVHAMIFSDDAPGLENILHNHFDDFRINKVNLRKEFFHVDLDDIKRVVLENHNATVKFVDVPDAIEYRETLKLSKQPTLA